MRAITFHIGHRGALLAAVAILALQAVGSAAGQDGGGDLVVRGVVADSVTGAILPSATVQVEGTYRGAVANADGHFEIRVVETPATLVVRFIGYRTARVRVDEESASGLRVRLAPSAVTLPEVVVSGEDPAIGIMRRVIEEKQRRAGLLDRYRAEAYTRMTVENDTGIVAIVESLTDVWWDRQRGSREIVRSRRQTANLDMDTFMPAAVLVRNLYADDVEVAGHRLMGVTHPDALDIYDFRLEGTRSLDDRVVYDISARPKSDLTSAFEGRLAVLDEAFAIIEADLVPSSAFRFPPPIRFFDVRFIQQFTGFAGDLWLPVDFRATYEMKVSFRGLLDFPILRIRQTSGLGRYEFGAPLPDSLYAVDDYLEVDTAAVREPGRMEAAQVTVPLTESETRALAAIDSTDGIEEAFRPGGLIGRAVRMSGSIDGGGAGDKEDRKRFGFELLPDLTVNRVGGWQGVLGVRFGHAPTGHLGARAGYAHGPGRTILGAEAAVRIAGPVLAFGVWESGIAPRHVSRVRGVLLNSAGYLVSLRDYFDYLERDRVEAGLSLSRVGDRPARIRLFVRRDSDGSLGVAAPWIPLGEPDDRANPPVFEGVTGSGVVEFRLGAPPDPFGIAGANHLEVEVERAVDGLLGGERSFTRVRGRVTARIETLFRRRALPNALDVVVDVQTGSTGLPPQRFGIVDGNGLWSSFGGLRVAEPRFYEGGRHLLVAWEHHFRTVPFELAGWRWAADSSWGIILHGGSATVAVSEDALASIDFVPAMPQKAWHHEVGISLSGVLDLLRLDSTWRIDRPGWSFSVGAARVF